MIICMAMMGIQGVGFTVPVTFNDSALLNAVKTQWEAATGLTLSDPPEDTELANAAFTELTANGLGITDLTGLDACTSLTAINLGLNQILDLTPLSGLTALVHLDVGFGTDPLESENFDPLQTGTNLITDISTLAGLVNLEYLNIMGNTGITSIAAVSTMDSLNWLWLASNPLTDFSALSDVADSLGFLAIINCGLENSHIAIINGLINLQGLGLLAEENLTDISGLTDIRPTMIFAMMFVPVTDVSVLSNYTGLQMMDIEETSITTIPDLSGLTSLQEASFIRNQITDISGISGITSLQEIDLTHNLISSISALESCTGLRSINISENQLTDIQPLLNNTNAPNFQWVSLSDNLFVEGTPFCDENQLDQLKALAPSAGIDSNAVCGPAFYLTISVNGTGTTSPEPGVIAVSQNTEQWLNAFPIAGSGQAFTYWSGDINSTDMNTSIFMDSDKAVTANFGPGDWTLTIVNSGATGNGTWPNPGVYSYLNGQMAQVGINIFPGAYFNGWSGAASGFSPNAQILMDANKTVTADFVSSGYELTLHVQGNGNINEFWGNGPFYYASGANFDIHASSYDSSYRFDHWEGNLPSGADPNNAVLPVVMDQNRDLTAVFVYDAKTLTIIIAGGGATNPAGSPSPGTQYQYSSGSSACVNAISSSGVAFDHWEGDIGSAYPYNQNICVPMDRDRTLTAVFVAATWNLTLQANGNGTTDPIPGVYGYANGVQASFGYQLVSGGEAFNGWTGDINPGSEQNRWISVTMDRNRTVTANFVPGEWTLTISAPGGGTNPNPGTYAYMEGQTATVNAYSNQTSYFAGWTGDVTDDTPFIDIVMDGNKSVTANFGSSGYTLTVDRQGDGGINLQGTHYLASGTVPVLKASNWGGWKFSEWTGDVPAGEDPTDPELPVLMDQDRSIIGVFVPDTKTLTIIIDGPGSTDPAGSADPGTQYEYSPGQNVCIHALPGPNVAFSYWSGDIEGGDPQNHNLCFYMNEDHTITAHFVEADWNLTLLLSGNGAIDPEPGTYGYVNGTWVNFTAVLIPGGDAFYRWTGDIDTNDPGSFQNGVSMDQDRTVTANFVPGDWTLTLAKTGPSYGAVSPNPGTYSYLDGQTATVSASSNDMAYFAGWTGDIESDTPNLNIVMESNISITAGFVSSGFKLETATEGQGWINLWGTGFFASGMEPVLKANPQYGWVFDHWSGDLPEGADAYATELPVLMDRNRSITAVFVEDMKILTIIIEGQGATIPAGAIAPGIQHEYVSGSQIGVSAEPGMDGWAFSGWSGDIGYADPANRYLSLTMNQDRTIVATYVAADWSLTVAYTGIGSTWPVPGTYGFMDGAAVEVVANISSGSDAFDHWEGGPEDSDIYDPGQRFTIHNDMTMTAVFTPGDYTLTSTVTGGGSAEYVSHPTGTYQYLSGRNAHMEVRPWHDTYWGGYSGDVTTFDYTADVLMDGNKNVTITMGTSGYELVVNQTGGGITNPSGAWKFVAGATPTIHAIDDGSILFDHWSGELPGDVDPMDRDPVILMDQHRTVIANFTNADWYLYIQASGNGTTDPAPDLYWFLDGAPFEITATPGADTLFLHWQGDVPEGQDPTSLSISGTMTQNRELIAVFVPTTLTVPDLSGMTQAEAEIALLYVGLALGTVTQEYSSLVPLGQIISQNPDAETVVDYGSAVSIVISLGPCYASVPNLAGMTQAEAETALAAANLTLGTVADENSEIVPEGQIIRQQPVYGLLVACGSLVNIVISSGVGGEGSEEGPHTADQDDNNVISLSELLRVIQFYNSSGLHCQAGTEDGYAPGPGDQTCAPHDSDYNPQDWLIDLSELLRLIQFFNSGGYHACPGEETEDGYCPGLA